MLVFLNPSHIRGAYKNRVQLNGFHRSKLIEKINQVTEYHYTKSKGCVNANNGHF